MPAKFEGVLTEYGFDKNATPSWLMVPDKGFKRIRLTNAANVTLSSTSPSIATIEEAPSSKVSDLNREFLINGKMKGTTFIEARQGGALVARLEVAVKVKKTVNVAFNFVEDNAGHKTSRTAASTSNWIDEINKIYLPQANIEFKKYSTRTVKIDKDLGTVVRFSSHLAGVPAAEHEWDLVVAKGDSSADYNVFFVWEYEQDATPDHDDANAGTISKNTIMEDDVGGKDEETLAHEIGHFLGCDDTYAAGDKPLIMYGIKAADRGRGISKAMANIMNP